eukprot:4079410-Pyramimonas_sp.AAC.1
MGSDTNVQLPDRFGDLTADAVPRKRRRCDEKRAVAVLAFLQCHSLRALNAFAGALGCTWGLGRKHNRKSHIDYLFCAPAVTGRAKPMQEQGA